MVAHQFLYVCRTPTFQLAQRIVAKRHVLALINRGARSKMPANIVCFSSTIRQFISIMLFTCHKLLVLEAGTLIYFRCECLMKYRHVPLDRHCLTIGLSLVPYPGTFVIHGFFYSSHFHSTIYIHVDA